MSKEFTEILPLVRQLVQAQTWVAPALYMVATPIGNLADISLRALYVLEKVDVIACEDTRHSQQLLAAYGLKKNLLALHQHNEAQVTQRIIQLLQQGSSVAYISDAGTPAVSDPGARLSKAVQQAQLRVIPIPGASSITALLSVAGLVSTEAIVIQGFLPSKSKERSHILQRLQTEARAVLLLEAPHRIEKLAQELQPFGERLISVGRELTKQFEQVALMPAQDFAAWLQADAKRSKGEFALLLHQHDQATKLVVASTKMLQDLTGLVPTKLAAQLVADWTGEAKNTLYQQALQLKKTQQADLDN